MDPEKELLDIPTELEINLEESNDQVLSEVEESQEIESNNLPNVDGDTLIDVNEIEPMQVDEVLPDGSELSNSNTTEIVTNDEGLQPEVAVDTVVPPLMEDSMVEPDKIDVVVNSVEPLESLEKDSTQSVLQPVGVDETIIQPTIQDQDTAVQTQESVVNQQIDVNSVTSNVDNASVDNLVQAIVQENPVIANQTVPTIQPLDSTTPPDELNISVDSDKKIKKNPKRKKKFKPGVLVIILLLIGIGCAAYFVLPKFLNKKSNVSNKKTLSVVKLDFKDSFENAYPSLSLQTQESVEGSFGTYSIENDKLVVVNADNQKYVVTVDGLYFTNVKYYGSLKDRDYLKLADDFSNNYIINLGKITKDVTYKYDDPNIINVPSNVVADNIKISSYADGRGVFYYFDSNGKLMMLNNKDDQLIAENISEVLLDGQDISLTSLGLSKSFTDKLSLDGIVFDYYGGVYAYNLVDGKYEKYTINDVESKSYSAKSVYLASDEKNNYLSLYIIFEKDTKEYVNVINLLESDFNDNKEILENYSKPIKSKNITEDSINIVLEDGQIINK